MLHTIYFMDKKTWLVFGVLVVLVIGTVLFFTQQQKIASVQNQNPENSDKETLKQDQDYPQHIEAIPENTDEVWYNIPELGVRMKLNKEFAEDLIYSISYIKKMNAEKEEVDVAYFSTRSMMSIDVLCAPEKGSSGGAMSRNRGIAKEVAKSDEYTMSRLDSLIQIGNFYYIYTKPQSTCWDKNLTPEVLKLDTNRYRGGGVKSLDEGFKNIQIIPEEK